MEHGLPSLNFSISASRVSSPSAAKIGAGGCLDFATLFLRDMSFDVFHLLGPATIVHAQRLDLPMCRNLIEAGLGDDEQRPLRSRLQAKFHQSRRLGGVIDARVDCIRVPGE